MPDGSTPAPRPLQFARDAAFVVALRATLYALRARGIDGAGARAIDYSTPRVQSSVRCDVEPHMGPHATRDRVQERLDRIASRAASSPELAQPLAVLMWLRACAAVDISARQSRDLRALLDDARTDDDIAPVLRALALSSVAATFVAEARREKWSRSKTGDGALTWARDALETAVAVWGAQDARPQPRSATPAPSAAAE